MLPMTGIQASITHRVNDKVFNKFYKPQTTDIEFKFIIVFIIIMNIAIHSS